MERTAVEQRLDRVGVQRSALRHAIHKLLEQRPAHGTICVSAGQTLHAGAHDCREHEEMSPEQLAHLFAVSSGEALLPQEHDTSLRAGSKAASKMIDGEKGSASKHARQSGT